MSTSNTHAHTHSHVIYVYTRRVLGGLTSPCNVCCSHIAMPEGSQNNRLCTGLTSINLTSYYHPILNGAVSETNVGKDTDFSVYSL